MNKQYASRKVIASLHESAILLYSSLDRPVPFHCSLRRDLKHHSRIVCATRTGRAIEVPS